MYAQYGSPVSACSGTARLARQLTSQTLFRQEIATPPTELTDSSWEVPWK